MGKAKNRSIKMTDLEFETVKQGAIDRKLTIGKFQPVEKVRRKLDFFELMWYN